MAISNRGMRKIIVDGNEYRWKLPRYLTTSQEDGWPGVTVLVMSAEPIRAVLRLYFAQRFHPNGACGHLGTQILPSEVATFIREAIVAGWQPQQKGNPFVYRVTEEFKENARTIGSNLVESE